MNSTKANAIAQSGNAAVFCPVTNKVIKAEDTKRVDYEATVKNKDGKTVRTTMKTLRVSPEAFKSVLKALNTDGIESVE